MNVPFKILIHERLGFGRVQNAAASLDRREKLIMNFNIKI